MLRNKKTFIAMVIIAALMGVGIAIFMSHLSRQIPIGYYKPVKGLTLDARSGTFDSSLGSLPIQNPITYDIAFGEPVPWFNNTQSQGVEFLVLENELIRANEDGVVKFIRSDRAWRRTHIDIDNGIINGHQYMTIYEYVHDIQVKPGDEIKRGDILGQGSTGRGSLYFEIDEDGKPINPIRPS